MSFNVDVLMFKVANLPVNLLHYRQHIVRKQVEIYVGIALQPSRFLAKNLAYAECRIMKFHYRNSSTDYHTEADDSGIPIGKAADFTYLSTNNKA